MFHDIVTDCDRLFDFLYFSMKKKLLNAIFGKILACLMNVPERLQKVKFEPSLPCSTKNSTL